MKLSTLINYRTQLKKLDLAPMQKTVQEELAKVLYVSKNQPMVIGNIASQLEIQEQTVHSSIDQFEQIIVNLKNEVDQLIREIEKPYFYQSYNLYENEMNNETLDDLKNRHPNLPQSSVEFYRSRISRYIGWQHPAMIVRPGYEPFINDMVSCDPLYVVDIKHELLDPAISQFNEVYQSRLRRCVTNERSDQNFLTQLPDSQFGLVLAFNYFNFRPFEIIKSWLIELLQKLKPGGMLLLTINDCDRDKAVMLVEQNYCCYTPGGLVVQLAQSLGFEIVFQWHDYGSMTWIEFKKPGTLTTLRGGQTLAKILPKPVV